MSEIDCEKYLKSTCDNKHQYNTNGRRGSSISNPLQLPRGRENSGQPRGSRSHLPQRHSSMRNNSQPLFIPYAFNSTLRRGHDANEIFSGFPASMVSLELNGTNEGASAGVHARRS